VEEEMKQKNLTITLTALAAILVFTAGTAQAKGDPFDTFIKGERGGGAKAPAAVRLPSYQMASLNPNPTEVDLGSITGSDQEGTKIVDPLLPKGERMGEPDDVILPRKKGPQHAGEKMCCAKPGCNGEEGQDDQKPKEGEGDTVYKQCSIEKIRIEVPTAENDKGFGDGVPGMGKAFMIYKVQTAEVK